MRADQARRGVERERLEDAQKGGESPSLCQLGPGRRHRLVGASGRCQMAVLEVSAIIAGGMVLAGRRGPAISRQRFWAEVMVQRQDVEGQDGQQRKTEERRVAKEAEPPAASAMRRAA